MRIRSMHPAPGWRAVFVLKTGEFAVAEVAFFAHVELEARPGSRPSVTTEVVPLVADDHDYARGLVPAEQLGRYALVGPGAEIAKPWLEGFKGIL